MEADILEVLQFIPSVHKSSKQFGFRFAYDAAKVWLDDIYSATSLLFSLDYDGFCLVYCPLEPVF